MKKTLVLLLILISFSCAFADRNNIFRGKLHYAKEILRNSQLIKAYPPFMELYEMEPNNANVNYSLGVCYTLEHVISRKSIYHLEKAIKDIALDYEVNPARENQAPVYAYYYLVMAYTQNGECEKAKETLKIFKQIYGKEDLFTMDAEWMVESCVARDKKIKDQEFPTLQSASKATITEKPTAASAPTVNANAPKPTPPNTFKNVYKTKITTNVYNSKAEADKRFNSIQDSLRYTDKNEEVDKITVGEKEDIVVVKPIEYTTKEPLYGVQIGAFATLLPTRTFDGLKNVEVYMDFNGIVRYVIGGFTSKTYAEKLLSIIQSRGGYENAYIVDINQKNRYGREVISMNNIPVRKYAYDGKAEEEIEYRIQVGAFRDLSNSKIGLIYMELDDRKEINIGDVTLLTVGSFNNYEDAQNYLRHVRELGILDAFIVAFTNGVRVPIPSANK